MARARETYPFTRAQLIPGEITPEEQPVLPIVICGPHGSRGMPIRAALVDTGADYCTCPSRVAKPLGYKIRSGKLITFGTATTKGKAWRHLVDIAILTHDYRAVFHRLSNVPLDLVQRRSPFPVLLGRIGFLDRFVIRIDFKNKLFTLELP